MFFNLRVRKITHMVRKHIVFKVKPTVVEDRFEFDGNLYIPKPIPLTELEERTLTEQLRHSKGSPMEEKIVDTLVKDILLKKPSELSEAQEMALHRKAMQLRDQKGEQEIVDALAESTQMKIQTRLRDVFPLDSKQDVDYPRLNVYQEYSLFRKLHMMEPLFSLTVTPWNRDVAHEGEVDLDGLEVEQKNVDQLNDGLSGLNPDVGVVEKVARLRDSEGVAVDGWMVYAEKGSYLLDFNRNSEKMWLHRWGEKDKRLLGPLGTEWVSEGKISEPATRLDVYPLRDKRLRDDIIDLITLHSLGLVKKEADKIKASNLDFEERVQAGIVGVMDALRKFDEGSGNRFSTYVVPFIKGEIKGAKRLSRKEIVPPVVLDQIARAYHTVVGEYEASGLNPRDFIDELAAKIKVQGEPISPDRLTTALEMDKITTVKRLDRRQRSQKGSDKTPTLGELIRDEATTSPVDDVGESLKLERAWIVLGRLEAYDRLIALLKAHGISNADIAKRLGKGTTPQSIQIKTKQVDKQLSVALEEQQKREELDGQWMKAVRDGIPTEEVKAKIIDLEVGSERRLTERTLMKLVGERRQAEIMNKTEDADKMNKYIEVVERDRGPLLSRTEELALKPRRPLDGRDVAISVLKNGDQIALNPEEEDALFEAYWVWEWKGNRAGVYKAIEKAEQPKMKSILARLNGHISAENNLLEEAIESYEFWRPTSFKQHLEGLMEKKLGTKELVGQR